MKISHIQTVTIAPDLSEIDSDTHPGTLEDILKNTLASANEKANADTADIAGRFSNPGNFADPGQLIRLQAEISDYNIYVSMASTLTRKAVSAVETLVKAQ